jgi:hypothetical protein
MPLACPRARPAALALALALAAAACGDDGNGPGDQLTGRYALVAVNGRPLPYATDGSFTDNHEVTAATLAFSGDRVIEEQRYQRRTFEGTVTTTAIDTLTYTYALRDGLLVFVRRPVGGVTRADTAAREGDLFVVRHDFATSLGTLVVAQAAFAKVE